MASPLGEVITLQFGNYANWAGSHFWNFQDEAQGLAEGNDAIAKAYAEVDSRVLYRIGETHEGTPTYTPRMVFFDLCGSMGGVSKAGYLYGADAPDNLPPITTWDGNHKVYRTEPAPKSSFLRNLEGGGRDLNTSPYFSLIQARFEG